MNDFETKPRGTMKAMHQASVRLASMKAPSWSKTATNAMECLYNAREGEV